MPSESVETARQTLQSEAKTLQAKADSLNSELVGVESELACINSAIDALDGKLPAADGSKPKKKRKSSKPSASRAEVVAYMLDVLELNSELSADELRELAEDKLKEDGYSLSGFALRFKEALTDPRFVDCPGGVNLAKGAQMPEDASRVRGSA